MCDIATIGIGTLQEKKKTSIYRGQKVVPLCGSSTDPS